MIVPHYQIHLGQHYDSPAGFWTLKVSEWKNLQMLIRSSWQFSFPAHRVLSHLLWMRCRMIYYEAKDLLLFHLLQNIKKFITKLHSTWLLRNIEKVVLDSKCKPRIILFSLYVQLLLVENIPETKVDVNKSCTFAVRFLVRVGSHRVGHDWSDLAAAAAAAGIWHPHEAYKLLVWCCPCH